MSMLTLNYIWWWGSSSGDLENMEYLFSPITPRSTLTQSGLMYGSNRFKNYSYLIGLYTIKNKFTRNNYYCKISTFHCLSYFCLPATHEKKKKKKKEYFVIFLQSSYFLFCLIYSPPNFFIKSWICSKLYLQIILASIPVNNPREDWVYDFFYTSYKILRCILSVTIRFKIYKDHSMNKMNFTSGVYHRK